MPFYSFEKVSLATLIIQETKAKIYDTALAVAKAVGLPVTTWQAGDPTRSLFHLESEILSAVEVVVVGYIRSGFLDYAAELAVAGGIAARAWLTILAKQQFNVDVPAASFATTTVTLTNSGVKFYELAAGDLTFKNTLTGKTYVSTSGGTLNARSGVGDSLGPVTTLDIDVVAEEAGSDSSAGGGEIDELVTVLFGVTCSNATAAVGVDEQDPATTVQQCRDKLGALSPNGPKEAYSYVARNPDLTGTTSITRVRAYPGTGDTGDVTVYLATASGAVTEADRALVETAILHWATPIGTTPTVVSAAPVVVNVTYEAWIYKGSNKTADEAKADILAALESMFSLRPIGGDVIAPATGRLYHSLIESTIRDVFLQCFRVALTTPAGDTDLAQGEVAALGVVTGTVTMVNDP